MRVMGGEVETRVVKCFMTSSGSIYTRNATDGKYVRERSDFRTERFPKKDITVFVDIAPEDVTTSIFSGQIWEEGEGGTHAIVSDMTDVTNPGALSLVIIRDGWVRFRASVSLDPHIGSSPFEIANFTTGDGVQDRIVHLGHEVVDIEYESN